MVQEHPDGYLDLWARGHGKSLCITYAGTIQGILIDPELTWGLFSYNNDIARQFLKQIKRELETNEILKWLFDDILYQDPRKESPKWTEKEGICVRRKGNPKEQTVEAYGLIDNMPTSKHYNYLIYDDVIERRAARSPEMMSKAYEMFELSLHLGTHDKKLRAIGTRYRLNDPYHTMIEKGIFTPRLRPGTKDGTRNGEPVYLTPEEMDVLRETLSIYNFSAQILQNPVADSAKQFQHEWLLFYEKMGNWKNMNRYILVDPATTKKKTSDYTAIWVVGVASDGKYYVLDLVRDRLSLPERLDMLFALHEKWKPNRVGYEKYGMQSDIEAIKMRQAAEMYHFNVVELRGAMAKEDRIEKLMPLFKGGKIFLPRKLIYTDWEGQVYNLIDEFINTEYLAFPNGTHDDMLDALARVVDTNLGVQPPKTPIFKRKKDKERRERNRNLSWLSG